MAARRPGTMRANAADRHAGRRLRQLRLAGGLTQRQLAGLVGISSQQVHKYEAGINRLTVGWVAALAAALGCKPGDFFDAAAAQSAHGGHRQRRFDIELGRLVMTLPASHRLALLRFIEAFPPAAPGAAGETDPTAGGKSEQARIRPTGPAASGSTGRDDHPETQP